MNSVLIVIGLFVFGIFCESETSTSEAFAPHENPSSTTTNAEPSSEHSVFNLMPLKILLEHQLRLSSELRQTLEVDDISEKEDVLAKLKGDDGLKLISEMAEDENRFAGACEDTESLKDFSPSEISKLFIGKRKIEEKPLSKEELDKIYDSLKNCYFMRVRDAKLMGPLWHCINRLFLFFLFH